MPSPPGIAVQKNGVASLAYDPVIRIDIAKQCPLNRDCRDKPGNNGVVEFENLI
jgi:hypothetical protein